MRVEVVHTGGRYAERVIAALEKNSPGSVTGYQVPAQLPLMVDDPEKFLPAELGGAEVLIAINLHQDLLLEIPYFVKGKATRALIAPIEDPSWIRLGLQRQVTAACAQAEIESAFPKPFCSLEPTTPVLAEFCRIYRAGRPEFKVTVRDGKIESIEVVRGSPCGLSEFVAEGLEGMALSADLVKEAGTLHHSYPCLASMNMDEDSGDTIMHHSVDIQKEAVREALEKAVER
ncbi:MAG: thymidylate synthase [Armatimonadetes bacterium]|nr:thymidylate synthase [Armatimonadota bacterium]NIM23564.1 thymidylate synthase [Armatimonadota bacterium]NIM67430.1 thymidylate synthase [Armatimonadota bacterium]NIM75931.1 thymidylate synthase [Armatimonadota bacterium]NIN05616.1 thymidylate synthase [Armatimonadota bacterium]